VIKDNISINIARHVILLVRFYNMPIYRVILT